LEIVPELFRICCVCNVDFPDGNTYGEIGLNMQKALQHTQGFSSETIDIIYVPLQNFAGGL